VRTLVASVRVRLTDPATAEIGRLVVAPDRQGSDLGTALVRRYQRLGYRETGRAPVGRYDLVHLAKTRAAAPG
jgi:predicted GNAT family N-acyltransferase